MDMNPPKWFCSACRRPLFSWERADGRCIECSKGVKVTLTEADIESAIRQFICSTRPELATGHVINVQSISAIAIAYREPTTK
jgi:hypothetical protein